MASNSYGLRSKGEVGSDDVEQPRPSSAATSSKPSLTQTERGEAKWPLISQFTLVNAVMQGWKLQHPYSNDEITEILAREKLLYSPQQIGRKISNLGISRTAPTIDEVSADWEKKRQQWAGELAQDAKRRTLSALNAPANLNSPDNTLEQMKEQAIACADYTRGKKRQTNLTRAVDAGRLPPYFTVIDADEPPTPTLNSVVVESSYKLSSTKAILPVVYTAQKMAQNSAPSQGPAAAGSDSYSTRPPLIRTLPTENMGRLNSNIFYWHGEEAQSEFLLLAVVCPLGTTVTFDLSKKGEKGQQLAEVVFRSEKMTKFLPSLPQLQAEIQRKPENKDVELGIATLFNYSDTTVVRMEIPPIVFPPNMYGGPWDVQWKLALQCERVELNPLLTISVCKIQLL